MRLFSSIPLFISLFQFCLRFITNYLTLNSQLKAHYPIGIQLYHGKVILCYFTFLIWFTSGASPQIGAGQYHTVVILGNGSIFSWGDNDKGQLGDGTNITRYSPVAVDMILDKKIIIQVAAGLFHTVAISSDRSSRGDTTNFLNLEMEQPTTELCQA